MRKTFKGEVIRELLWKCATRTTVTEFDAAIEELRVENEGAFKYLKAIPPHHWTRAHYSGRAHCDTLLNNICESFNSRLVEGREKPIISCLEYIREYLMKRIVTVQKVIDVQKGHLTPAATMLFEVIKNVANKCTVIWNGENRFQVKDSYREQCVVDIRERTCTCTRWQLTGIPCKHAVCGLWSGRDNSLKIGIVEDWVHPCYRLETWKEVYAYKVEPVCGSTEWLKSNCLTKLLPPFHKPQVGRWQLTGIPCKHEVCGLWSGRDNSLKIGIVEDWVHPCYRLETWKEVYAYKVEPVCGSTEWPKSNCPTKLLPPFHKPQVGRPKKVRKKSTMEIEAAKMVKNGKLSRAGKSITCGKCRNKGHNATNCKGQGGASQAAPSQSNKGVKKRKSGGATASQASQGKRRRQASQGGTTASQAGTSQVGDSQV